MSRLILILLTLAFLFLSCAPDEEEAEIEEEFKDTEDIEVLPDNRQLVAFERVTDPIRFLAYDLEEMYGDSAEHYWRYDLQTMVRADYKDLEFQNQFVVELFKFPDPTTAFGLYTLIRPEGCDVIEIGTEAFAESNHLTFLKDRYVSDIAGFESAPDMEEKIMKLAEAVEAGIPGPAQFPEELSVFPSEDKIPCSEAYIHKYFLDQKYLNSVFTCEYDFEYGMSTAFFINENGASALNEYLKFIKLEGEISEDTTIMGCRTYALTDPEFGNINLYLAGESLLGLISKSGGKQPLEEGAEFIRGIRGFKTH
ncbi:MAG: hypothetical protein GF310_05775 [candidate division Zixibacteria bacterium]|nr:hypothetical protein [candidate division Zixibacteria bacterium]